MDPETLTPAYFLLGAGFLIFVAETLLAWAWAVSRLAQGRSLLPPFEWRRVPWGPVSILATFGLYVGIQFTLVAVHRDEIRAARAAQAPPAARPEKPGKPVELTPRWKLRFSAETNAALLLLLPLLLRITGGASLARLGLGMRDMPRNLARGFVAFLLVALGCYLLMAILTRLYPDSEAHDLVKMLRDDFHAPTIALAILSGVVLAPIAEELVFRGVLLGWLTSWMAGNPKPIPEPSLDDPDALLRLEFDRPAPKAPARSPGLRLLPNVITAALFAALHAPQWPAPIPLFFLALVLGELAQRTGSLWASITLHACFNGLSIAMLLFLLSQGLDPEADPGVPAPAPGPAGVLAASGACRVAAPRPGG